MFTALIALCSRTITEERAIEGVNSSRSKTAARDTKTPFRNEFGEVFLELATDYFTFFGRREAQTQGCSAPTFEGYDPTYDFRHYVI
jgi:hypothetical protein